MLDRPGLARTPRAFDRRRRIAGALVAALWAWAAGSAGAVDLTGERVDLVFNFGNGQGSVFATIGPGPEFVLEGDPFNPGFSVATIDVGPDTISITHDRPTGLGPGLPVVSDDFLDFSFPNAPSYLVGNVVLTNDPMPTWFAGLSFGPGTISLTQTSPSAGVNTQLKIWTIEAVQGQVWGGDTWGQLRWTWRVSAAVPGLAPVGLVALTLLMAGAGGWQAARAHRARLRGRPRAESEAEEEATRPSPGGASR